MNCLHLLALLGLLLGYVEGYNLEERLPLYKFEDEGNAFGFSVALHKTSSEPQQTGSSAKSLLVVGSPTARALPSQTNAVNPGGVFYCPVSTNPRDCVRIVMDEGESTQESNKTDQWLGVSLKSQGDGKYLITCAHRFSSRSGSLSNEKERVCGKCFLLNNRDNNKLYEVTKEEYGKAFIPSPCDDQESDALDNKNAFAYTQAGVSASWIGDEYLVGGPGAYSWIGGMFDFKMAEMTRRGSGRTQPKAESYETLGCAKSEWGTAKCAKIPLRRDSYMGFSVATSNAINNAGLKDNVYVAGAPRGNFTGAVVMYQKQADVDGKVNLAPLRYDIVMGEQIGSSFGFSVAVTDINGDGLDDLLVGAPQYYQYSTEGKHGGAVYIYVNTPRRRFGLIEPKILLGKPDSFFGYSVAPLGDIDQDGFNDFAVGAPYERSGKVYVYRGGKSIGSQDGVFREPQVIDGSEFVKFRPKMSGFGIALSANVDVDNNKYPDLLVGSLTDQVILFRTRPIITVDSTLTTSTSMINLNTPDCQYNGKVYSCFRVEYCFNYSSRHKEYKARLPIRYTVKLDAIRLDANKRPRVLFESPKGEPTKSEVVNLPRAGEIVCPGGSQTVYFKDSAKDRLRPIRVDFEFALVSDGNSIEPERIGDAVFQMIDDPILDADYRKERSETVMLFSTCGDDGCQSNLRVGGEVPPEIVVGGSGKITLKLNVSNDGEEAHQASVSVKLPPSTFYDNYTVSMSSGADVSCKATDQGGSTFVKCSLGNPYRTGSVDEIDIDLDVSRLTRETKRVAFEVIGSTSSENPDLSPLRLYSKVIIEMKLTLRGSGSPQQVRYAESMIRGESAIKHTDEIGPAIWHTFTIKNDGLQTTNGTMLNVSFPHEINNGKWLLYLVSMRVERGGGLLAGNCTGSENLLQLPSSRVAASRMKRKAQDPPPLYQPRVSEVRSGGVRGRMLDLNCRNKQARCLSISCTLQQIQSNTTVSVSFQSNLWNATFAEEFGEVDLVDVGVFGKLTIADPNVRLVGEKLSAQITTRVDHDFFKDDIVSVFPWWYILIGILIALIIYAIIIFLLIKCGFFKRRRYPVREPEDNVTLIEDKPLNVEERT